MRVAIVNDLAMATETLRRLLMTMPGVEIAWTASDGREAVEKSRRDRPDLILMDMVMPVMDGPEATRRIMRESPCAIVVVTATVGGNAERVFEALSAGALDATETPSVGADWERACTRLERKIRQVRRLRGLAEASGTRSPCEPAPAPAASPDHATGRDPPLRGNGREASNTIPDSGRAATVPPSPLRPPSAVRIAAIGASTGGPAAIATILGALPVDFPFALVAVQHLEPDFVPGLVEWLARETGRRVALAEQGAAPCAGVCSIAPGEQHLRIGPAARFDLSPDPTDAIHRPSVDVLFQSLLESRCKPFAAVLLTGMGRDGADGFRALRRAGWETIAQDQATSVVWGMPGSAARSGGAAQVLPLDAIAPELMRLALAHDQERMRP